MKLVSRLVALVLLAALAALAVDRRRGALKQGYEMRALLEDWAALENEVRYLEGEVCSLRRPGNLLRRARMLGVDVGERGGREIIVPEPESRPHGQ